MKKSRRALIFVALLSLLYCVTLVQDTYAKYISGASGTGNLTIARWNVLINDVDIVNNSNFSNVITPTFENNTNIRDGVIAPTAQGTFDVVLDVNQTDVSLTYSITVEEDNTNTVRDLKILSYTIDNTTYTYTSSGITGNILYTDVDRVKRISFIVSWVDDAAQGAVMNNANDTEASKLGVAAFKVNVNVIQLNQNAGNGTVAP